MKFAELLGSLSPILGEVDYIHDKQTGHNTTRMVVTYVSGLKVEDDDDRIIVVLDHETYILSPGKIRCSTEVTIRGGPPTLITEIHEAMCSFIGRKTCPHCAGHGVV